MIDRILSKKLFSLSRQFPIVSVMGPRQSGKTTLVKSVFPKAVYISLEDPDTISKAEKDPRGFLNSFKNKMVVIDEVQRMPSIFSYIQTIVDDRGKMGQFIFTGSQNYLLHQKVTQSLAGRVAILRLLPLSVSEISGSGIKFKSLEVLMQKGFYPALWNRKVSILDWYSSYIFSYLERDVRQIQNIINLSDFQKFIRLCAGRAGQILNLTSLGSDCGISHNTAKAWLSILEASFIVHLLQPYYENFNKRIIKAPKLYFLDSGLLCYLLNIYEPEAIVHHHMKGAVFENFIFTELIKSRMHKNLPAEIYYWRDKTGNEIDFILPASKGFHLIEAKAGETIGSDFLRGMDYFRRVSKRKTTSASLVYSGKNEYTSDGINIINWRTLSQNPV